MIQMEQQRHKPVGIHGKLIEEAKGWDRTGNFDIQLYDAKLAVNVFPFEKGQIVDTFELALMDVDEPQIVIHNNNSTYTIPLVFDFDTMKIEFGQYKIE